MGGIANNNCGAGGVGFQVNDFQLVWIESWYLGWILNQPKLKSKNGDVFKIIRIFLIFLGMLQIFVCCKF